MTKTEKIKLAARILQVPEEVLENCCGEIEGCSALYFSIPEKGGASLIVGDDGTVLYADSSVGYQKHLEAYLSGIRTPFK